LRFLSCRATQAISKATPIACIVSKLEGEGKAEQFKGKAQNAVGGLKDTLRGK
jgi:hypothetical protein